MSMSEVEDGASYDAASVGSGSRVSWLIGCRGRNQAAASPPSPATPREAMAAVYAPVLKPATRIVPAMAVPSDEPRLEMERDNPEISPCWSSPKLDCTTLTDGVSMPPSPNPTRSNPGTNAQMLSDAFTSAISTAMPAMEMT